MNDKELFFKYNLLPTDRYPYDDELSGKIQRGEIKWQEPTPIHDILLLLHGSYACNLQCIYCENQHLRTAYNNATISEDIVSQIVEKLGSHLKEVTWHGGEPLVLPKSLLILLEDEKKKYNLDFKTTLQTNSVLLDKETLDFLDQYDIQYGTSFDGINNTTSRGKASTDAILRTLRDFPHRVGVIGVTYSDTIDKLIENYEYYKSVGLHGIQSCIVRENVIEESNPYLVKNEIAIPRMLEYIDYWIHDTDRPIRDEYVVRFIERVLGRTHTCEDINCLGGWFIIDPLGNIGFCGHSMLDDPIVNIKDINSYDDLIIHPNYLKSMYKQKKLIKSCEHCEWYRVCYGACMGLNYEYSHDYSKISPRNCEYIKGVLTGIYELIKDIDVSRRDMYNPIFLESLETCRYYSLTKIKEMEGE